MITIRQSLLKSISKADLETAGTKFHKFLSPDSTLGLSMDPSLPSLIMLPRSLLYDMDRRNTVEEVGDDDEEEDDSRSSSSITASSVVLDLARSPES